MKSLWLLVPFPSLGVIVSMILYPESDWAKVFFFFSKIWVVCLPVLWHVFIDQQKVSFSPMQKGGMAFGVLSGIGISLIIFSTFYLFGDLLIDFEAFKASLNEIGLGNIYVYIAGAAYWILINSVVEEYVWRWFVVKKCEEVVKRGWATVVLAPVASALFFTLHHVVAMSVYFGFWAVVVCSIGVFSGGLIWSWMYVKYRSIWPGYVSHAIVDLCIFGIGYYLLFG